MFEVSVEDTFAAGHSLRNYRGKCENVHGHNYRVRVTLEGEDVNPVTGLLVDFVEVKRLLRKTMAYLDHQFINDLPPFTEVNPSAENIAKYFCEEVQKGLDEGGAAAPVRIQAVTVWETDTSVASYRP
ncbi:MAG: 6-carboxytetrahydropterin synthase QueD [Bryobacterales bacterium]|nr:6-carboxytetrahydropterin synthase QueD [Bryobacterales bacterium]